MEIQIEANTSSANETQIEMLVEESATREIQNEANTSSANETQIEVLVNDITTMFKSAKCSFSIKGSINTVPDHLRRLNEQAFTPRLISIGPIHYSNRKLRTMSECKVRISDCFITKSKINLVILVSTVREMETEIRSCYAGTIVSSMSSDDFVKMILVEASFILELFLREYDTDWKNGDPIIEDWMPDLLRFDLLLIENQLPFFVLDKLLNLATFPDRLNSNPPSLIELAFKYFEFYNIQGLSSKNFNPKEFGMEKIEHFTDLIRIFHLSSPLPGRSNGVERLLYSATQLDEAGVKFKVSSNRSLLGIKFDLKDGVLEIPRLALHDETVDLIRNLIVLEQSRFMGKQYITDYFAILDFLINTTKDMDLLCEKGILVSYLGDSTAATSAVNNINTNILWSDMNSDYKRICKGLNEFYKKPWHRWKATLRHQYFSTPWRAASTVAAIVLLVLTLIQAVCSVIQIVPIV